jgi:hypothetical protein
MAPRDIDLQASTVTIRTKAKGLLSRLAHDLEIAAERFEGEVEVDGAAWRAELRFPVRGLRVVGAVRAGSVDRAVLSTSDREEIERRIRDDALRGGEVKVVASGAARDRAEVVVTAPSGEQRSSTAITVEDRRDGELVVHGKLQLSLRRLGVPELRGPLGAFKVDDAVEVAFWMMLDGPGSE